MDGNGSNDLVGSNGFWAVVGACLGDLGLLAHDWQKRRADRNALGSLLYGELVTMAPGDSPTGEDPPTARLLVFTTLPQVLAPGVLSTKNDSALLMLLIQMQNAVVNFNDKARTYNTAWASDQHPDMVRKLHEDLELTFWDYRDAHKLLLHQIKVVGELGGPMDLEALPELAPWEELREWWRREVRFWQHRQSARQWFRGGARRVRRYVERGLPALPVRRPPVQGDAQDDPREDS